MVDYRSSLPPGHRFHHLGVPVESRMPGMRYIAHLKFAVTGYETSPYRYEWMHFDADCPLPALVKTKPHICFEVDDLERALNGRDILIAPTSPTPQLRVAFITFEGAPIELLQVLSSARLASDHQDAGFGSSQQPIDD